MPNALIAVIHLVCLPLGVGALVMRYWALKQVQAATDLRRLFFWDNIYGIVAATWIASGLYRAFGATDKGSAYYLGNHVFWLKMLLVLGLFAIELRPMSTFIRWRLQPKDASFVIDEGRRKKLLKSHQMEFIHLVAIVVAATLMARGIGMVGH